MSVVLSQPASFSTTQPKQRIRAHIRWMIRRDMTDVLRAEQFSFTHAWSEEDFLQCLRHRNCIGMVAEHNDRVAGFMIYELFKTRIHVLSFMTMPECRRSGVGTQMMMKLAGKLSSQRRSKLTAAVRESNLVGQLFLRSQGFTATRVSRGYFEDSGEDAYLMHLRHDHLREDEEVRAVSRAKK